MLDTNITKNIFGIAFRKIREGRGASRQWVHNRARSLGFPKPVTVSCLKLIERGIHKPSRITMAQLKLIFNEVEFL
jgi:hypothetical protein